MKFVVLSSFSIVSFLKSFRYVEFCLFRKLLTHRTTVRAFFQVFIQRSPWNIAITGMMQMSAMKSLFWKSQKFTWNWEHLKLKMPVADLFEEEFKYKGWWYYLGCLWNTGRGLQAQGFIRFNHYLSYIREGCNSVKTTLQISDFWKAAIIFFLCSSYEFCSDETWAEPTQ